ncbi:hypothetical protein KFE25_009696 [Diacronema lutheri]|uniref:EF-hand domain-containing protein n=2 Tax=Diacronema lutheri TaxID=2081491 RepID=A0A8J6CIE2_DIALT|nr:hypothetical protein KFE25_009696 [Diacronema lutheri]
MPRLHAAALALVASAAATAAHVRTPKVPLAARARAPRAAPRLAHARVARAAAFAHFDTDGDGFISARELGAAFERLDQPLTVGELAARMRSADLDADARISLDEFEALCAREERADGGEADYGFEPSGYYGADVGDPATPTNGFRSAAENFKRELAALRRATRHGEGGSDGASRTARGALASWARPLFAPVDERLEGLGLLPVLEEERSVKPRLASLRLRDELDRLQLSNEAISRAEKTRIANRRALTQQFGGQASPLREVRELASQETPWFVMLPYQALCLFLDAVFDGRPLARFWFLETVARVPYFVFTTMLHLYETLGWWRGEQLVKQLHFAQESNELHHLLIMEALGGDARWSDRFLARHAALLYFGALCALFFASPALSYNFSELLESHAVDTYGEFLRTNKQALSALPAPKVARDYYNLERGSFLRRAMRTSDRPEAVPPPYPVVTLYDVFANIAADEGAHVSTMRSCQDSADDIRPLAASFGNAGSAQGWDEYDGGD